MANDLYVHRSYGCDLWPETENGPLVVYSCSPGGTNWAEFAGRISGGRHLFGKRDARIGTALPDPAVVEVIEAEFEEVGLTAAAPFPAELAGEAANPFVRLTRASGQAAIEACKTAFERGADLVIMPGIRKTFPKWSTARAGSEVLEACFGGGVVCREYDVRG